MNDWKELEEEYVEMAERLSKLSNYSVSEEFMKSGSVNRYFVMKQLEAMDEYRAVLYARMEYLKWNNGRLY